MSVRKHRISKALESFSSLMECLSDLTEEEVMACLELEAASQRRSTVIDRLISRAVRLREISLSRQLKEKYHGASQEHHQDDQG